MTITDEMVERGARAALRLGNSCNKPDGTNCENCEEAMDDYRRFARAVLEAVIGDGADEWFDEVGPDHSVHAPLVDVDEDQRCEVCQVKRRYHSPQFGRPSEVVAGAIARNHLVGMDPAHAFVEPTALSEDEP